MTDSDELIQALVPVVAQLEHLGVRYLVGGSVASSYHGAARSTADVDLSAELAEAEGLAMLAALQNDYYGSEVAIRDAVRRRSCFNLLHYASSFKVDIFVSKQREFDRSAQDRATSDTLSEIQATPVRIATVEDVILLKLEWYRLGNEASDRQWSDMTTLAKLHAGKLDEAYLRHWASDLRVVDLLEKLLQSA